MSAIRTWQLLLWKDTRRLCISWKSENRLNVQTVESFFKARRGLFSTCVSTHWTPKRIISFPAQNLQSASTKRIQGPIWVTTEGEFTKHQQDQANGCALLVRVKKSPDLFSTTTSIKNTNKIMPMWIVLNVPSYSVQNETWEDMLTESTKQLKQTFQETQMNQILMIISIRRP